MDEDTYIFSMSCGEEWRKYYSKIRCKTSVRTCVIQQRFYELEGYWSIGSIGNQDSHYNESLRYEKNENFNTNSFIKSLLNGFSIDDMFGSDKLNRHFTVKRLMVIEMKEIPSDKYK